MKALQQKCRMFYGCLLLLLACNSQTGNSQPKQFEPKTLVVARNKTVSIKELGLSITNKGCGREWMVDDAKRKSERPYCELTIKHRDSTYSYSQGFEPITIGDIRIQIERINPWGAEEDSLPRGPVVLLSPAPHKKLDLIR